jgi:hypothetical protein
MWLFFFAVFADFIHREARVKTDPSFNLPPSRTVAKRKRGLTDRGRQRYQGTRSVPQRETWKH